MKKKIIGFFIFILLIVLVLSAYGSIIDNGNYIVRGNLTSKHILFDCNQLEDEEINITDWLLNEEGKDCNSDFICYVLEGKYIKDTLWDEYPFIYEYFNCSINDSNIDKINGIDFYQVNYDWVNSKYENSNTGEIIVDINKVKKSTGMEAGFINVYSDQGWIIQNLAFFDNYAYNYLSRFFNLGRTGEVTTINAYVQVTAEPVSYFEYSGAMPPYPVLDTTYDAEGGNESVEILRPQPPPANVPGNGDFVDPYTTFYYIQDDHPNVACCKNQCVPAAYANNLQYLENIFGTTINDELICGFNGTPSNSLSAIFDVVMQRKAVSESEGSATSYRKALEGFVEYTFFESLPISLKHQGIKGSDDVTFQGVTSYGQGSSISVDFIINEMKNGHAIAMAFNWYKGEQSVGGHMVQLVAAGKILGVPFIQYLDDIPQGNCNFTTNKVTQSFIRDWDFDGNINLLNAPWWAWTVNGPAEIVQLVVMVAENQPPLKPPMPSGGELFMETDIVYSFSTSTTDPNEDQIWYLFDWGDGTNSSWIGPKDSGEKATAFKVWNKTGIYNIKVKARDYYDAESEWSDERVGFVPKFKPKIEYPFIPFLQQFPNLFRLIKKFI